MQFILRFPPRKNSRKNQTFRYPLKGVKSCRKHKYLQNKRLKEVYKDLNLEEKCWDNRSKVVQVNPNRVKQLLEIYYCFMDSNRFLKIISKFLGQQAD